jgi:hypothetical protein
MRLLRHAILEVRLNSKPIEKQPSTICVQTVPQHTIVVFQITVEMRNQPVCEENVFFSWFSLLLGIFGGINSHSVGVEDVPKYTAVVDDAMEMISRVVDFHCSEREHHRSGIYRLYQQASRADFQLLYCVPWVTTLRTKIDSHVPLAAVVLVDRVGTYVKLIQLQAVDYILVDFWGDMRLEYLVPL